MAGPEGFSRITSRLADAADRLRIDAAIAEIVRAFGAAGVQFRVLKGPSLVQWLYEEADRRGYLDADLWVRPGHETGAEHELQRLGFVRRWDQSTLPDWWREHGSEWSRESDGVLVDLHRNLAGIGADPEVAWNALADPADDIAVGAVEAPALPLAGRALHVSLHAAQHGAGWGKGRADLERALVVADEGLWREAAALAARVDAVEAFAAGLRMAPDGERLAQRLELPQPSSVDVALRAATAPPVALGVEQLARAAGWRARAAILGRKLVPPAEFMRHWDRRAADSRPRLALAYVRRPFWLLRHAPAGARAWWRARRQVRR